MYVIKWGAVLSGFPIRTYSYYKDCTHSLEQSRIKNSAWFKYIRLCGAWQCQFITLTKKQICLSYSTAQDKIQSTYSLTRSCGEGQKRLLKHNNYDNFGTIWLAIFIHRVHLHHRRTFHRVGGRWSFLCLGAQHTNCFFSLNQNFVLFAYFSTVRNSLSCSFCII